MIKEYHVIAGVQVSEAVGAICRGGGCSNQLVVAIKQLNGYVSDTRFAIILHAIRIRIIPDQVAEGGRFHVAKVYIILVLARVERNGAC